MSLHMTTCQFPLCCIADDENYTIDMTFCTTITTTTTTTTIIVLKNPPLLNIVC